MEASELIEYRHNWYRDVWTSGSESDVLTRFRHRSKVSSPSGGEGDEGDEGAVDGMGIEGKDDVNDACGEDGNWGSTHGGWGTGSGACGS